jgi:hypothetical protein
VQHVNKGAETHTEPRTRPEQATLLAVAVFCLEFKLDLFVVPIVSQRLDRDFRGWGADV